MQSFQGTVKCESIDIKVKKNMLTIIIQGSERGKVSMGGVGKVKDQSCGTEDGRWEEEE